MAVHHARPGEVVDLNPLGEGLRNARTTAIVKSDAFEAVRLVVPAAERSPRTKYLGRSRFTVWKDVCCWVSTTRPWSSRPANGSTLMVAQGIR